MSQSDSLKIADESGPVLEIKRLEHGAIMAYGCVGGRSLTREQAKQIRDWLDDGDESVARGEAERLRAELDGIESTVADLLDNLADAWWLNAAEAYRSLSSWVSRRRYPR